MLELSMNLNFFILITILITGSLFAQNQSVGFNMNHIEHWEASQAKRQEKSSFKTEESSLFIASQLAPFEVSKMLQRPLINEYQKAELDHHDSSIEGIDENAEIAVVYEDESGKIQPVSLTPERKKEAKFIAKNLYVSWGYNRSVHHNISPIHFETPDGNFSVDNAVVKDRWDRMTLKEWLTPSYWAIPQYNFSIGYQWSKDPKKRKSYAVEAGIDHMKYVVENQAPADLSGEYNKRLFYYDQKSDQLIESTFDQLAAQGNIKWMEMEHTDGYNYVFTNFFYMFQLLSVAKNKIVIQLKTGAGVAAMIPRTQTGFMQDEPWKFVSRNNRFHLAGYGINYFNGMRVSFGKKQSFFLEAGVNGHYVHMVNALVNDANIDGVGKISHHTLSAQFIAKFGFSIDLSKKNKKSKIVK